MRTRSIVLIIAAALAALVGFGLAAGGSVLLWAHATQRDAQGFYVAPTERYSTSTYALVSNVELGTPGGRPYVLGWHLGDVRIRLGQTAKPLFIGIGPTADVQQWLAGTRYEELTSVRYGPFRSHSRQVPGGAPSTPPGEQSFWVASGTGEQPLTLQWPVQNGDWSLVLMNADASAGVVTDVELAAKSDVILPIASCLLAFGLLLLVGAIVMLVVASGDERRRNAEPEPAGEATAATAWAAAQTSPTAATAVVVPGSYPVRLDGHLDPETSRWLWLVKFILVIPHAIVLAFLWIAVVLLTIVAGVSILFTGRYPRSLFDFNVGVMRWTWRVGFYSVSAFGTDRYPPFSLQPDPSYPADFTVDYPERLSRGLVLVKWWLLALPHLIIVGILAGGPTWTSRWGESTRWAAGGGVISLLALLGIVVMAVSGRYPESLFDVVMGMNRWCYRVMAYVGLMRDEYPPFRFDGGGSDPGTSVPEPIPTPPPSESPTPDDDRQGSDAELVGSSH